jgi:hypothetical protein
MSGPCRSTNVGASALAVRARQPEDDQRCTSGEGQVHGARIIPGLQWLLRSPRGHHGASPPASPVPSTSPVPTASVARTVSMTVPARNLSSPQVTSNAGAPLAPSEPLPRLGNRRHQQALGPATAPVKHDRNKHASQRALRANRRAVRTQRPRAYAGFWDIGSMPVTALAERVEFGACDRPCQWGEIKIDKNFRFTNSHSLTSLQTK